MSEYEFVGLPEFNLEFNVAKTVVRSDRTRLAEQQERLRTLVLLMPEEEHAFAQRMIDRLPELTAPPPPLTARELEAMEIAREAAAVRGTREEVRAALSAARKRIWEIADSAPKDEAADIRGLTRSLDHLEQAANDPFWEFPEAPAADR